MYYKNSGDNINVTKRGVIMDIMEKGRNLNWINHININNSGGYTSFFIEENINGNEYILTLTNFERGMSDWARVNKGNDDLSFDAAAKAISSGRWSKVVITGEIAESIIKLTIISNFGVKL